MNWFIISRDFHVAATITTDNPTGLQIFDDTENTVIENNCVVGSYDFSVNNAHPDAVAFEMGSYIVFYNKRGELKMYTLVTFDMDENIAKWHAEDVGMDLLQETATAWNYAGQTHPIAWYLENLVLYDTGWSIGINEVADMTRSVTYTGQSDTQLRRLGDVANAFDGAEITFTVRMEGNRVTEQLVNIRRKVGRVQTDTRYIDERNIKSLTSAGSIESLRTCMVGIGSVINKPDGSQGEALSFTNISYDDGRYYSPVGHNRIYDRVGRTKWSRFKAFGYQGQGEFDGYMVGTYTYDTEDPNELLQRTLANLKTVNNPVVTYEAKLHEIDADIGDYLQMADTKYTPTLYLQARLVGISVCYTQDGLDEGVLGDYTKLQSAIDPRVQQMFDRLAMAIVDNYTWTRYAEDDKGTGITAAPNIRTTHVAFLSNQKTGVPSDDPADYAGHWVLIKGDKGDKGADGDDGVAGKDGVGVKATVITYAQSTSGATPPTASWAASVPTLIKGQYLWTKTVWTYTDSDTETGYTVSYNAKDGNTGSDGRAGKDGTGIKLTVIDYVGAVSGTSKPASGWSTTIPTVPAGQYLWTRTTWQYTDGTSEQGYTNALMGRTGAAGADGVAGKDGIGIKSTVVTYQLGSSGTAKPTGAWSATVPTLTKGQYLWTKTTWAYSDSTTEDGFSVAYIAKDGSSGTDGLPGKDGTGIKSTVIEYAVSSSGVTKPTTGWSTNIPSVVPGQFMWTRTTWLYTDNTNEVGYSVAQAGPKGPKGDTGQGIPGTPGADGRTPYLHTAWANSFNGKIGFSTDVSTDKSYMGTYVNFTEADPTDPALYNWIELVGALVIGGRNYLLDTGSAKPGVKGSGGSNQTHSDYLFSFGSIKNAPFTDGDPFTVSFSYLSSGTGAFGTMLAQFNNTPWPQFGPSENMKDHGRVTLTTTWQSSWGTGLATGIHIRMDNVATTRTVMVYNVQFESGNKATDHKVAPEDTQALIDSLSTPNLVYNAGLKGDYKAGLDGWIPNGTGAPNAWYRTTASPSMYKGVNGMGINYNYPASGTNVWHMIDSKHHTPIDTGQAFSASVQVKIYSDSTAGYVSAVLSFFDNKGNRLQGFYDMATHSDDSLNSDVSSTNPHRDQWQLAHADNVIAPAGAVSVAIQYYVHPKLNTASKIHVIFSAPVISVGDKAAPYSDNQGSGADITQTNDALIALNDVFDKTVVPVASITAPPSPKEGQGWWVLNSSQQMIGFKIYKNGAWADSPIQQSAMNIGTLNGNIINGATINSSNFNVAYDETAANTGRPLGPYFKGTQVIRNGSYLSDFQVKGSTQTGYSHITPDGITTRINDNNGKLQSEASLTRGAIELHDQQYSGYLEAGDVERTFREVWDTTDPVNGNYHMGFSKQFRRVWLDGVIVLPHGSGNVLFTIVNPMLRPKTTKFVALSSLGENGRSAQFQIDSLGHVYCIANDFPGQRYIAEGAFYLLDV